MNTTNPDTQLEYELQDLYISSKHWLSDVSFMADEIRFFKHLIDKYFVPGAKNQHVAEVNAFRKTISEKETETVVLKSMVLAYLNFLEPFVCDLKEAIGFDLIEKHSFLENQIQNQFQSLKLFKKDLFSIAEKLI
jgi:hypothetical protein